MRPRAIVVLLFFLGAGFVSAGEPPAARSIATERLLESMQAAPVYDLTATANGPRLQVDVVLDLIAEAERSDPDRRPLLIGHREWFLAFLARTGLPADKAPLYVRRPYEVGQDLVVDYRREVVIDAVLQGPAPRAAANVLISWPKSPGSPDEYAYEDVLSRPTLHVTQKRLIAYRLVSYVDRLWYAEITGLNGRPTSGGLGVLFDLIGEARVLDNRSAFSTDGLQIVRTVGKKWGISRTVTATIWPDGHADQGVPASRSDVSALADRLNEPLAIRFKPLPTPGP